MPVGAEKMLGLTPQILPCLHPYKYLSFTYFIEHTPLLNTSASLLPRYLYLCIRHLTRRRVQLHLAYTLYLPDPFSDIRAFVVAGREEHHREL